MQKVQIPRNFCGDQGENHPLAGNSPIEPISTATVRDALASAILVKTAENETVAFVGVQSGNVLKVQKFMAVQSYFYELFLFFSCFLTYFQF